MELQAVQLALCIGLSLAGLVATVLTWRASRRRGKAVQVFGLALLPIGLYLSGLLQLVWNFVASVIAWAFSLIFTPMIWAGLGLIGLAAVLWVVGGIFAARAAAKAVEAGPAEEAEGKKRSGKALPAGGSGKPAAKRGPAKAGAGENEMDEIEELLRRRGIE